MKTIDTTGLSCPEPVMRTRAALQTLAAGEQLEVLVDTVTARENVLRTARSLQYDAVAADKSGRMTVTISKK